MTVLTDNRSVEYEGNGLLATYTFPFRVFASSDLAVIKIADGVETLLTEGVDYTVDSGEDSGTVTLLAGELPNGQFLRLERNVPYTQEASLTMQGQFFPATLEAALDRNVMQTQQLKALYDQIVSLGTPLSSVPPRYTSATKPSPGPEYAGQSIRVKNTGQAEIEQICLEAAGGTWAWVTKVEERPTFYVRDFGGRGDPLVDDQPALQAALDAADAAGGGRVRLLEIPSVLHSGCTYGDNTIIEGYGENSRLEVWNGGVAGFTLLAPKVADTTGIVMRDFAIDCASDVFGPSTTTPAISIDQTIRANLHDLTFSNVQTMAVWCASPTLHPTRHPTIQRLKILNGEGGGISLFGAIEDFDISENYVANVKDDAVAVQDLPGAAQPIRGTVGRNRVMACNVRNPSGSTPNGIRIYGCANVALPGNEISDVVSCGIEVQAGSTYRSSNISITGSVIDNAGQTASSTVGVPGDGIRVQDSDGVTLGLNTVQGSRGAGIHVRNSTGIGCGINTCRHNEADGISFQDVRDFTLGPNVCMNNGDKVGSAEPYGVLLNSTAAVWSSGTTYAAGNKVSYGGDAYQSLQSTNLNHQPDTSPTWWVLLRISGISATWSGVTTYAAGDRVWYSGQPYQSLQAANLNHVPSSSPTWWVLLTTTGILKDGFVANVRAGDDRAVGSKTQTYGLYLAGSGMGNVDVGRCNLNGNATGPVGGVFPLAVTFDSNRGQPASDRIVRRLGTALVVGDFTLSSSPGWGTSPSVSAVRAGSTDTRFEITIQVGSGSPGTNPYVTFAFKDGAFAVAPFAQVSMNGGTATNAPITWSSTTGSLVLTYNGTPAAGSTVVLSVLLVG